MFIGIGAGKHHATFENLQKAGENGCLVCSHVSYGIRRDHKQHLVDQALLQYSFDDYGLQIEIPEFSVFQISFRRPKIEVGGHPGEAFDNYIQSVKDDLEKLDYCIVRDNSLNAPDDRYDSTGETQAMEYAISCLQQCQRGHQGCHETAEAVTELQGILPRKSWYPKRLIDCSPKDGKLHLVYEKHCVPGEGYATLSYCWGTAKFFTLTLDREKEVMFGKVSLDELPLAFREAIKVCNELCIRYLWIDSICIVQSGDNGEDWLFHAREMSKIYSACLLNIAAEHISHPSEGLFSQRQWRELIAIPAGIGQSGDRMRIAMERSDLLRSGRTGPVDLSITRDRIYELSFAFGVDPDEYVLCTKLSSRGWVLQERCLSPRALHFSRHRIAWSCRDHISSEWKEIKSSGSFGFRINKYVLGPCSEGCPYTSLDNGIIWGWWEEIIRDYSQRQLSFPEKDKLVALAGVIQVFNEKKRLEYLAGMFRNMLHWSLLWKFDTKHVDNPKKIAGPRSNAWKNLAREFPSWSWASVNAPIEFLPSYGTRIYPAPLMEVADAEIDLLDEKSPYGHVKSCTLLLKGLLVSEREMTLIDRACEMVDDGRYTREGHDLWFLPTMRYLGGQISRPFVHGLALQRHRENEDEPWSYYRVGVFQAGATNQFNAALEITSRRILVTLV